MRKILLILALTFSSTIYADSEPAPTPAAAQPCADERNAAPKVVPDDSGDTPVNQPAAQDDAGDNPST